MTLSCYHACSNRQESFCCIATHMFVFAKIFEPFLFNRILYCFTIKNMLPATYLSEHNNIKNNQIFAIGLSQEQ